jgi:hypothetical protein
LGKEKRKAQMADKKAGIATSQFFYSYLQLSKCKLSPVTRKMIEED